MPRYQSFFKDVYGVSWEAWIYAGESLQEEIALADNGIEIEWGSNAKDTVIFSSSCTITIESSSDRKFIDLYTVAPGDVKLYVFRAGKLYWCGLLDAELYEEPFAQKENYEVSLTFSDFGILDRLKWDKRGFIAIKDVINKCFTGLSIPFYYQEYISTSRIGAEAITLVLPENLLECDSVLGDNFFDEEGDPLTLKEVLEAVLRPYDLHIIQKGGVINIWDWNALAALPPKKVEWDSMDAVLSVDRVYNNVKVTFSPYAKTNLVNYSVASDQVKNITKSATVTHKSENELETIEDFDILLGDSGPFQINPKAKFFKIFPRYSGSDDSGIAWTVRVRTPFSNLYPNLVQPINLDDRECLMGTSGIDINFKEPNLQLKISMQILLSALEDPFSKPENGDAFASMIRYVKIPVRIFITAANGDKYYYRNFNSPLSLRGKWELCTIELAEMCYLSYYSPEDSEGFFTGWQGNKKTFPSFETTSETMKKNNDAEYLPFPPVSGKLTIEVLNGIRIFSTEGRALTHSADQSIIDSIKWLLYKDLTVDVVNRWGKSIKAEDVEFGAWINKSAKEELTIDTIVGTLNEASPVAQGQIFDTTTKWTQRNYQRGEHTARLEQLLIGSMYSQYATRHLKLSGTVVLLSEFGTVTDLNEPGVYAVMSEVQNIAEGTSEIEMVQISPDNYTAIEYN